MTKPRPQSANTAAAKQAVTELSPFRTVQEVADELRLAPKTVRSMCRTGVLHPVWKLDGTAGYRIGATAVESYLATRAPAVRSHLDDELPGDVVLWDEVQG